MECGTGSGKINRGDVIFPAFKATLRTHSVTCLEPLEGTFSCVSVDACTPMGLEGRLRHRRWAPHRHTPRRGSLLYVPKACCCQGSDKPRRVTDQWSPQALGQCKQLTRTWAHYKRILGCRVPQHAFESTVYRTIGHRTTSIDTPHLSPYAKI